MKISLLVEKNLANFKNLKPALKIMKVHNWKLKQELQNKFEKIIVVKNIRKT